MILQIRLVKVFFVTLALSGCAPDKGDSSEPRACNGHPDYCDRSLDMLTFPGTHNSMSNSDAGWIAPNQHHGITRQLQDGVRALMLDTQLWEGSVWLCHEICELGAQPLDEGLTEIASFLDTHEQELLIVIFQDAIPSADTASALVDAGLGGRLLAYEPGMSWPTLGELLDSGSSLLVALESGAADQPGLIPAWSLFADTPYSFTSAGEFSCEENRGGPESPLFLMNHWIGDPLPDPDEAAIVNEAELLAARAEQCAWERGRVVNFIGVDFYDLGDLFEVSRSLNAAE